MIWNCLQYFKRPHMFFTVGTIIWISIEEKTFLLNLFKIQLTRTFPFNQDPNGDAYSKKNISCVIHCKDHHMKAMKFKQFNCRRTNQIRNSVSDSILSLQLSLSPSTEFHIIMFTVNQKTSCYSLL